MATQLQLRRGTTSNHSTFTGALAEPTFDTTTNTLVVHDGATTGGLRIVKEKDAHLTGKVAFEGVLTPSQITSDQNDYNPSNLHTNSTIRISSDAARTITGLNAGSSGEVLLLENVGSFSITLSTANTSSSAANRFLFATGDLVVMANGSVRLLYDNTLTRWVQVGSAVPNKSITYARIQDVSATSRLLGRKTAGSGSVEEINAGSRTDRLAVGLGNMAAADNPIQTGRVIQLIKEQGTTSLISIGIQAPTETNAGTSVDGSTFGVKRYITTTTADDSAGLITPVLFRGPYNADCVGVFITGNTITNYRFWFAATSATLAAVGAPTTQHVAGFRYDTSVDGTVFWRTVTCDGSSNVTTTTTATAFASATTYTLRILFVQAAGAVTDVYFYIDGVEVAHHTTNFPSGATNLSLQAVCSNVAVAATRRFDFSRFGVLIP